MNATAESRQLNRVPEWMGHILKIPVVEPLVGGAIGMNFDPKECHTVYSLAMDFCMYTTNHRVNGLLAMENIIETADNPEPQLVRYFFGYHCCDCDKVFLVPDWVGNVSDLGRAMRHECPAIKGLAR